MKHILFFLSFVLLSFASFSQSVDSTAIQIKVRLTKDQHKHAIRSLGINNMASPERRNYITDLLKAGFNAKPDTATLEVYASLQLIVDVFTAAASKPEGIVVNDNAASSAALTPQLMTPEARWALNRVIAVKQQNASQNKEEKDEIDEYMKQLK